MASNPKYLYSISFTDKSKEDILITKGQLITDKADVAFVGKTLMDYGEIFNENALHLLENFASPEDPSNPGFPDLSNVFGALLENPVEGQIWYNITQARPFYFNGSTWIAMGVGCDVAGNYGVIAHGQQLPHPVCPVTGYVFQYEECTWMVSPFNYPQEINYMQCFTDSEARVTMQYRMVGDGSLTNGLVNYQIIGIKNNTNLGSGGPQPSGPPAPSSGATPTPTPTNDVTPTPTVTTGPTPTPTATTGATPTPTTTVTPSETPPPGVTATPTVTPTKTPAVTPTKTPASTPNPTQSGTPAVTPTSTAQATPTPTPTRTPSVTPSITPSPSNDTTGDVISGSYSCHTIDASACFTLNYLGEVRSLACGINSDFIKNGFRPGEDGSDYTFTMNYIAGEPGPPPFVSGPTSGNFGSNQVWCLGVSLLEAEAHIEIDITGPPGTASGTVELHFYVDKSGGA